MYIPQWIIAVVAFLLFAGGVLLAKIGNKYSDMIFDLKEEAARFSRECNDRFIDLAGRLEKLDYETTKLEDRIYLLETGKEKKPELFNGA